MIPAETLSAFELPLPAAAISDLSRVATSVSFRAGEVIVKEDAVCRELFFIRSGAARGFTTDNGLEYTHWFAFEKDFLTSFRSFITGKPATENIQAIEAVEAICISKEDLYALFPAHRDIETLVRMISERYYIRLEMRFVSHRFRKASELYEELINDHPHIIQRVPLGMVASYLGITQETLSRVRAKL